MAELNRKCFTNQMYTCLCVCVAKDPNKSKVFDYWLKLWLHLSACRRPFLKQNPSVDTTTKPFIRKFKSKPQGKKRII